MVRGSSRSLIPLALAVGGLALAAPLLAQRGGDEGPAAAVPVIVGSAATPKPPPPAVPVTVLAVPFPISGAIDDQLALLVEIGGRELLVNNDGPDLAGEIEGKAIDAAGQVVDQFTQVFALDASDESVQHDGLKLYAVLRVPPGDYKVKVDVRNTATRGHGSREVSIHAPDFGRREAAMSPPLFADRPGRWRVFRQSDSPHEALPFPFVDAAGGGFLPAASPVLPPAGGEVVVYAYGALTDAQKVEARLLSGDGKVLPARSTLLDSAQGKFVIQRRLLLRLDGPLPVGSHRLEVTVADSAGGRSTATAMAVLDDAPPPAAIATAASAEQEPQAPVDEEPVLPAGWTREQLAARYHEVLARAARGDLDGAVTDLADLELAATPQRSAGQLKGLREVEKRGLEGATESARGLMPLVYLYARVDAELLRRGEAWMAAQNRLWTAELVERWVKGNGNDAASRHLAAQLLAGVGSSAEALRYEPGNELALLRLAISAEKGSLLAEAAESLRTLLAAHPESSHAKLRLGVVLHKQGQDDDSARLLGEVTSDPHAQPWIAGLAYQMLASMAHDKGQRERGEVLLRQGIDKLNLQVLYLQLAYYLDERQRPDEAVAVLNGMPVSASVAEGSGRHLYNAPPQAELDLARQQVEERVAGDWPQLGAALRLATVSQQGSSR